MLIIQASVEDGEMLISCKYITHDMHGESLVRVDFVRATEACCCW